MALYIISVLKILNQRLKKSVEINYLEKIFSVTSKFNVLKTFDHITKNMFLAYRMSVSTQMVNKKCKSSLMIIVICLCCGMSVSIIAMIEGTFFRLSYLLPAWPCVNL